MARRGKTSPAEDLMDLVAMLPWWLGATGLTPATVNKALAHLERIGVAAEITGKLRGRVFSYARYVAILNEGMALPGRGG